MLSSRSTVALAIAANARAVALSGCSTTTGRPESPPANVAVATTIDRARFYRMLHDAVR